jgi:predicted DNA-binding transcriptional regulator AlpA
MQTETATEPTKTAQSKPQPKIDATARAINIKQVCARINVSRGFVYKLMAKGEKDKEKGDQDEDAVPFPRPIKVGATALWLVTEIDAWLDARIAERDAGLAPKGTAGPGRLSKAALAARAAAQTGAPDAAGTGA